MVSRDHQRRRSDRLQHRGGGLIFDAASSLRQIAADNYDVRISRIDFVYNGIYNARVGDLAEVKIG